MYRRIRLLGLICLILSMLPLAVAQDKKDLDKDKKNDAKDEKLVKAVEITGTVTQLGEDKSITVKVTHKYMEPNASAFQNQQNLARRQLDIIRNPNPNERARQLYQLQIDIANNQRNLYTAKEKHQDVHFLPADSLILRSAQPPLAFDDKGNPRKYTKAELDELKGADPKLPGYKSEWDQLRTGQIVTVTGARKKDAADKPKVKDLDRDMEKKLLDSDKPIAMMIVIQAEPVQR